MHSNCDQQITRDGYNMCLGRCAILHVSCTSHACLPYFGCASCVSRVCALYFPSLCVHRHIPVDSIHSPVNILHILPSVLDTPYYCAWHVSWLISHTCLLCLTCSLLYLTGGLTVYHMPVDCTWHAYQMYLTCSLLYLTCWLLYLTCLFSVLNMPL